PNFAPEESGAAGAGLDLKNVSVAVARAAQTLVGKLVVLRGHRERLARVAHLDFGCQVARDNVGLDRVVALEPQDVVGQASQAGDAAQAGQPAALVKAGHFGIDAYVRDQSVLAALLRPP